jgi:hypothetical protein
MLVPLAATAIAVVAIAVVRRRARPPQSLPSVLLCDSCRERQIGQSGRQIDPD